MTKRAGKKHPQDPHQWYREPRFTADQMFDSLDFGDPEDTVIWDACCGSGNVLDVAHERGYQTFGSDIVDRGIWQHRHGFKLADFLRLRELPFSLPLEKKVSLACNPPYGKVAGFANMGERFVMHALEAFGDRLHRAAFILPIEFMAGQDRYWTIYSKRKPSHSMICCQRPSMPPGAQVETMGTAAFKGGMADYCILVWTAGGPYRTETIFMRPDDSTRPPDIERRVR